MCIIHLTFSFKNRKVNWDNKVSDCQFIFQLLFYTSLSLSLSLLLTKCDDLNSISRTLSLYTFPHFPGHFAHNGHTEIILLQPEKKKKDLDPRFRGSICTHTHTHTHTQNQTHTHTHTHTTLGSGTQSLIWQNHFHICHNSIERFIRFKFLKQYSWIYAPATEFCIKELPRHIFNLPYIFEQYKFRHCSMTLSFNHETSPQKLRKQHT